MRDRDRDHYNKKAGALTLARKWRKQKRQTLSHSENNLHAKFHGAMTSGTMGSI